ncbi:MAG: sulfurase, partial [Myxococcota bacterium]
MLHELVGGDDRRRAWFVHGARDGRHHPLADEVRGLAARAPNVQLHVAYSQPRPADELGRHYHSAGRVDGALLEKLVPGLDGDFYLCGPTGFMASVQEQLEARDVPAERIRSETF